MNTHNKSQSKPLKHAIIVLFCASIGAGILSFATPLYLMLVFERVLMTGNLSTLLYLTLISLAAIAGVALLEEQRNALLRQISHWFGAVKAPHYRAIAASYPEGTPQSQLGEDATRITGFLGSRVAGAALDAPFSLLFLLALFLLDWRLSLLAIIAALVLAALAYGSEQQQSGLVREGLKSNKSLSDIQAFLRLNTLALPQPLRLRTNSHIDAAKNRLSETQSQAAGNSIKVQTAAKAIRSGSQILILGLGALLVVRGELSMGAMVAASIFTARALAPFEMGVSLWTETIAARDSWRRLSLSSNLMSPKDVSERGNVVTQLIGQGLRLHNVVVSGAQGQRPRLVLPQLDVGMTKVVAVVGPQGSGKSTLLSLASGTQAPNAGRISLNGVPTTLDEAIGYAPDPTLLFPGTIAEIISGYELNPDMAKIGATLASIGLGRFIADLAHGLQTQMSPESGLSGGQRRLMSIASALYRSSHLVCLDNPTDGLAGDTIAPVCEALRMTANKGALVLVATQDSKILQIADEVIQLEDGRLYFYGTVNAFLQQRKIDLNGERKGEVLS
jgi:ABC-type protease/lipase transport system fused ATPase/permease subunit